ncbi:glyoxylate/hydroxypyruvate reductase A [Mesorhizobium sp. M1E.F.Ca.ET.045.02.1.1]|nr:glyoxylate/hydroxypyruvate reductase A [Mesorhizobium sp. M1E.F.Ca.ET.045.02.1.1]
MAGGRIHVSPTGSRTWRKWKLRGRHAELRLSQQSRGAEMTFLYDADAERGAEWAALFAERAPEIAFHYCADAVDPRSVKYLGVWHPPTDISAKDPNLEVLFSLGAGVDQFDFDALPAELPVVRMIEPGISDAMAEYVTLAVLALHRDLLAYRVQQATGDWQPLRFRPPGALRIGVLGTGVLAKTSLSALQAFGFQLNAWGRSRQSIGGVECFAGKAEMDKFLGQSDILVCLLPLTSKTARILNGALFAKLPPGAAIVNCGRGGHLVQADLLVALDSGRLSAQFSTVIDL